MKKRYKIKNCIGNMELVALHNAIHNVDSMKKELHDAIFDDNTEKAIKIIIDAAQDDTLQSILHGKARNSKTLRLFDEFEHYDLPPFFIAVDRENLPIIKTLIEYGADINKDYGHTMHGYTCTVLYYMLSYHRNKEIIDYLVLQKSITLSPKLFCSFMSGSVWSLDRYFDSLLEDYKKIEKIEYLLLKKWFTLSPRHICMSIKYLNMLSKYSIDIDYWKFPSRFLTKPNQYCLIDTLRKFVSPTRVSYEY